jgi:hypothetical protein
MAFERQGVHQLGRNADNQALVRAVRKEARFADNARHWHR